MASFETGPSENDISLTEKQQEVIDCVACFTVRGKTIEAADVAQCRGQSVSTVRSALSSLDRSGLIENTTPPEKRKNLYSASHLGMRLASPELDPSMCETVKDIPQSLTPLQQKTLDCAVCLTEQDMPVRKTTLASCIGSAATAAYTLKNLASKGLLYKTNSQGGRHENEYMLMLDGRNSVTRTASDPECPAETPSAPAERSLNDQENQLLACLQCQTARGMMPDRLRASLCLDISKVAIGNAAATLIERGIVASVSADRKPGLRTEGAIKPLRLTDVRSSRLRPGCTIEEQEIDLVFNRLSPERQRILGCMACILSRDDDSDGAVGADITRCADINKSVTSQFLQQLHEEGYAERRTGLSVGGVAAPFYVPTSKGDRLLDRLEAPQPCQVDKLRFIEKPNNIETSVIRCTSCIWTQQIAAGREPMATADMIAECSGFDRSNIASTILPRLVENGEYTVKGNAPKRYIPRPGSTLPLGYNKTCRLNLFGRSDDSILSAVPQEYIMRGTEEDSMKRFEIYVKDLRVGQIADDTDHEYDPFRNTRRFPLLTAEEESYLGIVIRQSPDKSLVEKAKFKFFNANIRLAAWMASERHFEAAVTSFEEVRQAALLGVSDAIDRFDPLLGFKFSTFAYHRMLSRIQHMASEATGIPAYVLTDIPSTLFIMHDFTTKNDRMPSPLEIAASTGRPLNRVLKVLAGLDHLRAPLSLSQNINQGEGSDTFDHFAGKVDADIENKQNVDLFKKAAKFLDDTERSMLENIVLGRDKIVEYARDNGLELNEAQKIHGRLMAKIRHPYFGLGAALGSEALAWHEAARCYVEDKSDVVDFSGRVTDELRTFCDNCSVMEKCDSFAQDSRPAVGVWAGKTARAYR